MEMQRRVFGPHTSIVNALRRYPSARVDFLASLLGWSRKELDEYLATLEQEGVVRRSGDRVSLAEPSHSVSHR